ncbi:hypothetical protein DL764_009209 [Monosporascus ibericus]|uniref:Mediator of RNA polymerase II transcription subunit 8 n=1 Tax=Monosporascus ibericus TaxID=155417 RepID=A0A4Q4SVI6_9PEZI|nr:hypothetical protein DL764_009209 [Monosporascus ibericus]
MASLNLSQEELKAVEQSRQRLVQLSNSIGSLKASVYNSNPLPNLDSLQASADILQHNLRYLLDIVTQHNDLFSRVAVHPSTNFPGRTQEGILLQLLRKKPEPDVAAAMDEGRERLDAVSLAASAVGSSGDPGPDPDSPAAAAARARHAQTTARLEETWDAARRACMARVMRYATEEDDDPYTEEERATGVENVRTGLRRPPDDPYADEDEEDEEGEGHDNGDVMVVDRPPPPPEVEGASLENIMRLSARGEIVA